MGKPRRTFWPAQYGAVAVTWSPTDRCACHVPLTAFFSEQWRLFPRGSLLLQTPARFHLPRDELLCFSYPSLPPPLTCSFLPPELYLTPCPTLLPRPQPSPTRAVLCQGARECLREAGKQTVPTATLGDLGRGAGQRPRLPCHR